MPPGLKIRLVQTHLEWEQPAHNREHFARLISERHGADLIVLPEMFPTGFSMDSSGNAESMQGESVTWMKLMARETGASLCGSIIIGEAGNYYNRFVLARPSGEIVTYDKRHLFRMSTENDHYSAGGDRLVFQIGDFRVFPQVCYDLRFPVFSRNALSRDNPGRDSLAFDLMIYVANWPGARREHWRTLLAARAIENQCYVVGVNRIGTDGNDIGYVGDSAAVSFDGSTLLAMADTDSVGEVTLDLAALHDYRTQFPAWKDADPFALDPPS